MLCAANDVLAHSQTKPNDMSNSLYQVANEGCGSCNLAKGCHLVDSVDLWMDDSDSHNCDRIGHRRWCLYPSMKSTGFGEAGYYTAMYAFDNNFSTQNNEYKVAWPAVNTPSYLFNANCAWSLSKDTSFSKKTTVKLTRLSDNKVWNFSSSSADGLFYIDNSGYGQNSCVIFKPNSINNSYGNQSFNVKITDTDFYVNYNVNFYCDHKHTDSAMDNYIYPQCTEKGSYEKVTYCTDCYQEISRKKVDIPALNHSWSKWITQGNKEVRYCMYDPSHKQTRDIAVKEESKKEVSKIPKKESASSAVSSYKSKVESENSTATGSASSKNDNLTSSNISNDLANSSKSENHEIEQSEINSNEETSIEDVSNADFNAKANMSLVLIIPIIIILIFVCVFFAIKKSKQK